MEYQKVTNLLDTISDNVVKGTITVTGTSNRAEKKDL